MNATETIFTALQQDLPVPGPESHQQAQPLPTRWRPPWQHQGSAAQRGYGTAWRKLRDSILKRDYYLCQVCAAKGRVTSANQVDHITPKAKQGTDNPDNLQSICDPCHRDKSARDKGHRVRPTIGLDGYPVQW